ISLRKSGKKRGQALGAELFLIGVFGFENAIGGEKDDVTRSQFNGCFIVLAIANEAERDFETDGLHTPVVPAIPSKPLRNDWFVQLQPTTQPTKTTALLRSSPRRPERAALLITSAKNASHGARPAGDLNRRLG